MLDQYRDYTTVRILDDQNIVLVGEEHGNEASRSLIESIMDSIDFEVAACEDVSRAFATEESRGAMGELATYTMPKVETDIWSIDKAVEYQLDDDTPYPVLIEDANRFTSEISPGGDVSEQAIFDAHDLILNEYGEQVYTAMYDERDRHMANYLNWLSNRHDGVVLAAMGAFHLPGVEWRLRNDGRTPDNIDDGRCY